MKFRRLTPLFDQDGEIGAASGADAGASAAATPEPSSVVTGGNEPPASGSAPAAGSEGSDVTQQASFASRLKEEREKIAGEYEPYKKHSSRLENVAKTAGFDSVEDYLEALDNHVQTQAAEREAQRLGVDPETYKQFFQPVHSELSQTKQQLQQLQLSEQIRQVRAEDARLTDQYPDYKEMRDQVLDLAEKRALPLEEAYKLVSFDKRVESARLEGQNAAVAALNANAATATGPVGGDAPNQKFDITKLPREERAKYFEQAKRGELRSLH